MVLSLFWDVIVQRNKSYKMLYEIIIDTDCRLRFGVTLHSF